MPANPPAEPPLGGLWRPLDSPPAGRGDALKVLVISRLFPHPDHPMGGAFVREMILALRRYHGVESAVISFRRGGKSDDNGWWDCGGVAVRYLPLPDRRIPLTHGPAWLNPVMPVVRELGRAFAFDLVHAEAGFIDGGAGLAAARWRGAPLVITEHANPLAKVMGHPLAGPLARRAYAKAGAVVAVSRSQQDLLARHLGEPVAARVRVIPNGVDPELFHAQDQARSDPDHPRILFLGGFVPEKDLPNLLAAFGLVLQRVPGARLLLVGGGLIPGQEDGLRAEVAARSLDKAVELRPQQPREEVSRILRQECDLLVLPSRSESFGCVLTEALASGRPVVATDSGGPADIVTGPALGELVPVGDAPALAGGLLKVIGSLPGYDAAAIRAQTLKHFSYETVAGRLAALYRELVGY